MLTQVLIQIAIVVSLLVLLGLGLIVGRERLRRTRFEWRSRVRAVAPIAVVLVGVLSFNDVAREGGPDVSWLIQWNLTWTIYDLEGQFVLWLQSFETAWLTAYFSWIYIYGYVFLLVFPVVAYFALSETRPLRELLAAYTLNYSLGLVIYVFIIAYGPRNLMPELVDALLYDTYPQYQHLTRQVNRNTNVFPSLHTSLAVTVSLLAYRTREFYPRWNYVAGFLGFSVATSTMYLGIHWAIDVVAGAMLAYVSVRLAGSLVGRWSISAFLGDRFGSLSVRRPFGAGFGRSHDADSGNTSGTESESRSDVETGARSESSTESEAEYN
ncbi:phosphatase PAP2 family protein [Natrarchaeobaculum aegyptiacum]|uniref:Phosphatidylglycerophosphatase n=1 Tax=Natrarchaeobaculum aegyptiacum TaxID=745377 RepID=A0A2Z2I0V6_9EURY|nr:phosphatase PAP2 family protein [Natrarchaeobaculum aegyptiacum]ARS91274.1 phosphatidylglycerophosphatase [Natrarchaeobaculum aegyptiacum]